MNCCPKVAGSDFVVSNESRAAANAAAQERFCGPTYLLAQHDALTPEDGDEEYETKVCRHCWLAWCDAMIATLHQRPGSDRQFPRDSGRIPNSPNNRDY